MQWLGVDHNGNLWPPSFHPLEDINEVDIPRILQDLQDDLGDLASIGDNENDAAVTSENMRGEYIKFAVRCSKFLRTDKQCLFAANNSS